MRGDRTGRHQFMEVPTPLPFDALSRGRAEDLLGSWKAISAYLKRDVSTVQRWEKRERMPVHRHLHDKLGSVYAFRSELDAWWARDAELIGQESGGPVKESASAATQEEPLSAPVPDVAPGAVP